MTVRAESRGRRGGGRPRQRWKDCVRDDLRKKSQTGEGVDQGEQQQLVRNTNVTYKQDKGERERKERLLF